MTSLRPSSVLLPPACSPSFFARTFTQTLPMIVVVMRLNPIMGIIEMNAHMMASLAAMWTLSCTAAGRLSRNANELVSWTFSELPVPSRPVMAEERPNLLLNTLVMMVKPSVPPKGSDTCIKDMAGAIRSGQMPTVWSDEGIRRSPTPAPVMTTIPLSRLVFCALMA